MSPSLNLTLLSQVELLIVYHFFINLSIIPFRDASFKPRLKSNHQELVELI